MVLSLELRHIKIYKGQKFIPISDYSNRLSSFIGDNGIGKSSILESLDVLFNNKEWNINIEATSARGLSEKSRTQPYIASLLLIEKDRVNGIINNNICQKISDVIFETKKDGYNIESFVNSKHIDEVKINII